MQQIEQDREDDLRDRALDQACASAAGQAPESIVKLAEAYLAFLKGEAAETEGDSQ